MYTVDLYLRVRLACHVDGLSQREAASRFGIARETVRKMLGHSEPPGYRRRQPPKRPKLDPFRDIIDRILEEDRTVHRKQRHTHGNERGRSAGFNPIISSRTATAVPASVTTRARWRG